MLVHVRDPADPRLDDYRHLTDAAARRTVAPDDAPHGLVVVEGRVALEQLLHSGHPVRSVLLSPTRAASLAEQLHGVDVVYVAEREVLAAVTGFDVHRGVLAIARRPAPSDPAEVVAAAERVLVVEGVTDNENVGALFRNAAALGLDAVLLDGASTDPLYRRSVRVSSGWTLRLPFARAATSAELLAVLERAGFRTVALTPAAHAIPVDRAVRSGLLDGPTALVVGAEGTGLRDSTIARCTSAVGIPMAPGVDSLNVATSLAVVAAFTAARHGWERDVSSP